LAERLLSEIKQRKKLWRILNMSEKLRGAYADLLNTQKIRTCPAGLFCRLGRDFTLQEQAYASARKFITDVSVNCVDLTPLHSAMASLT